jgi:hypothetical protein
MLQYCVSQSVSIIFEQLIVEKTHLSIKENLIGKINIEYNDKLKVEPRVHLDLRNLANFTMGLLTVYYISPSNNSIAAAVILNDITIDLHSMYTSYAQHYSMFFEIL